MKKRFRFLSIVLAAVFSLAVFAGCPAKQDPTATTTAATTDNIPASDFTGKLDGYTVVYPGFAAASVRESAAKLAKFIGCEAKADKGASGDYPDNGGLEILVGDTDRPESAAAKDALAASGSKRNYNYSVTIAENNRIVIIGDKQDATVQAVNAICETYLEKRDDGSYLLLNKGQSISDGYDAQIITASNGVRFKPEIISTVYQPSETKSSSYPTIIELQHSGSKNGIMLASFESDNSCFRVYRSSDRGETWKLASTVVEGLDPTMQKHWEPHLFELPCQVGDMPAGTVLLSGTTITKDIKTKSHVTIWRSFNQGKSWEQYSVVAEGGGVGYGVWEPFIMYENNALYCFYSDDSDPEHDQKLVYKKSTDGVNWGELVEIAAFEGYHWRPGMISIAKMGNGKYFMPYEICSNEVAGVGNDIYFKIVDDLDGDWQKEDHGTKLTSVTKGGAEKVGSAPFCAWTPAGGECGTLFVVARVGSEKYIYVSFDYGKSFEAIENPIPYSGDKTGRSPTLFALDDGKTVLYGNTANWGETFGQIKFARLVIEDPLKES